MSAAPLPTLPVSSSATDNAASPGASVGSKRKAGSDAPAASASAHAAVSLQSNPAQTCSASAASAAASHAHLASVLESPSAAAPIAKRTRRAAQSAQATAVQARSSPMIRLLGADSGASQSLLEMMDLSSIARLQCTGRSWRGWIATAPFIGMRVLWVTGDEQRDPSRCLWLLRSVQDLHYRDLEDDDGGDSSDDGEDSEDSDDDEATASTAVAASSLLQSGEGNERIAASSQPAAASALSAVSEGSDDDEDSDDDVLPAVPIDRLLLLPWSRLRSIGASFYCPLPSAELLRASFAAVAATLQCLDVSLKLSSAFSAANLLAAISSLHQLESLSIRAMRDWTDMDLSALPALPRLRRFDLRELCLPHPHPCSLAQVDALAQCKSLTDLDCGRWLEDGLGRLFRLRQDNGAAPLRRLCLGPMAMIFPPCWRVLSQFTALEEIGAYWSCTLTAADWMLLANFPQLQTLRIDALEDENGRALLDLSLALPALVHCRALRSLKLIGGYNGTLELRTEHAALLAQIPSLESFEGRRLRIESLDPLSHAPALTHLDLSWCVGLNGEPINNRAMIPPMPPSTS